MHKRHLAVNALKLEVGCRSVEEKDASSLKNGLGGSDFSSHSFMMIWLMDNPSTVHQLELWKHCNFKGIYPLTALVLDICSIWKLENDEVFHNLCNETLPGKEDGSLTVDFNRFQETMEEKKGAKASSPTPASPQPPYHHHYHHHHHHHHPQISCSVLRWSWSHGAIFSHIFFAQELIPAPPSGTMYVRSLSERYVTVFPWRSLSTEDIFRWKSSKVKVKLATCSGIYPYRVLYWERWDLQWWCQLDRSSITERFIDVRQPREMILPNVFRLFCFCFSFAQHVGICWACWPRLART